VASPLLEGIDLSGAKGVLVLITAAKGSLKLSESKLAMNTIRAYASADAHVIYGTAYDDYLGDQIRVTVVATGLSRQAAKPKLVVNQPQQQLRTGTYDAPIQMVNADMMVSSVQPTGMVSGATGGRGATTDYSTPSVWRNRTSAAQKVDALSNGGMDDFEIPAFLRKQAD
jgi:cell division protein FtsZ